MQCKTLLSYERRCPGRAKTRMGGYCQECRWGRRFLTAKRPWGTMIEYWSREGELFGGRLRRQRSLYHLRRR